jgi:hypothetical protein
MNPSGTHYLNKHTIMFSRNFSRTLFALVTMLGAVTTSAASEDESYRSAGRALDRIEKHLAEWGHASISSFVLVP